MAANLNLYIKITIKEEEFDVVIFAFIVKIKIWRVFFVQLYWQVVKAIQMSHLFICTLKLSRAVNV